MQRLPAHLIGHPSGGVARATLGGAKSARPPPHPRSSMTAIVAGHLLTSPLTARAVRQAG